MVNLMLCESYINLKKFKYLFYRNLRPRWFLSYFDFFYNQILSQRFGYKVVYLINEPKKLSERVRK